MRTHSSEMFPSITLPRREPAGSVRVQEVEDESNHERSCPRRRGKRQSCQALGKGRDQVRLHVRGSKKGVHELEEPVAVWHLVVSNNNNISIMTSHYSRNLSTDTSVGLVHN